MLSSSGVFRWIGGPDDGIGIRSGNTDLGYTNWVSGEPFDIWGTEDCLVIRSTGQWSDSNCGANLGFIIKFQCPVGMVFGATACESRLVLLQIDCYHVLQRACLEVARIFGSVLM